MDTIGRQVTAFVTMFMLVVLVILMYLIFEPQRRTAAANEQVRTESERGAALFAANCIVCHGVNGQGISGAGFTLNTDDNKAPDEERRSFLRNTLYRGRQNSNGWEPNMPVFLNTNGGPLNDQQIEDVITFIGCGDWDEVSRIVTGELGTPISAIPTPPSLGTPNARILPGAPATATQASAGAAADPGAGVFQANCIVCHKITPEFPAGAGVGPNLTGIGIREAIPSRQPKAPQQINIKTEGAAGLQRWIRNPSAIRPGSAMPAFGEDKLTEQQLGDLTKWLASHTTASTEGEKSCIKR